MSLVTFKFVMLWSVLASPAEPSQADVIKAQAFQYQQKISALEKQITELQKDLDRLASREKKWKGLEFELRSEIQRLKDDIKTAEKDRMKSDPVVPGFEFKEPLYQNRNMTPESMYELGMHYARENKWNDALLVFEQLARENPSSALADNAIYWMARVYLHKGEPKLAIEEYRRLLRWYPKSERAALAENKLKELEREAEEAVE